MNLNFYQLAIGAVFHFRGQSFRKQAMSMAEVLAEGEQRGWANIFQAETEVVSDGPLLSADEAAKWKPT